MPLHLNPNMVVALSQYTRAKTFSFPSKHQRDRTGHVDVCMKLHRLWVHAIHPQAGFLEILNETNQVTYAPHSDVIQRSS